MVRFAVYDYTAVRADGSGQEAEGWRDKSNFQVCKPTSTTTTLILEAVKTSRHILSFPERKKLCDLGEFDNFNQLVSYLVEDYSELDKTTKGQNVLIFKVA